MNYHWIGHCREGNSDKVWGMIRLTTNGDYVSFWGRRGKKLQTKIHHNLWSYDAEKLCGKKMDRGYNTINTARLDEVYPGFENDLQATTVWALLSV